MIIVNNVRELIDVLKTRINILQAIRICTKTVLLHSLHNHINKDVHKFIFNLQGKELLTEILDKITFSNQEVKIIENTINHYIKTKKIIVKDFIQLKWTDLILKDFLLTYLLDSPYWKLIIKELNVIQNTELPATLKEILNKNLQVGESIPIAETLLRKELHGMTIKPLIFVNGNIIWGEVQSTLNAAQAEREYHDQILTRYLHDETLHKNDIIHLSMDEWKKCDRFHMPCEYARLVTNDKIFIFMYGNVETNYMTISQIIHQKYNKPIFVITDYATHFKRLATRLIKKVDDHQIIIRLY